MTSERRPIDLPQTTASLQSDNLYLNTPQPEDNIHWQGDVVDAGPLADPQDNFQPCSSLSCTNPLHVLCTEQGRKQTFRSWPALASCNINPMDLIETFFYYTGRAKLVRCVKCGIEVADWKNKDVPRKVHQQRNPNCVLFGGPGIRASDPSHGRRDDANGHVTRRDVTSANSRASRSAESSTPPLEQDAIGLVIDERVAEQPPRRIESIDNRDALRRENERLKASGLCQQCKHAKIQTLFLPCRHLITCERCGDAMRCCAKCNTEIMGTVRIYFG